jgi:hypothetical protein
VEGFVDAAALFEPFAIDLFCALRAGQINEVKITYFCVDNSVFGVFGLDLHREN